MLAEPSLASVPIPRASAPRATAMAAPVVQQELSVPAGASAQIKAMLASIEAGEVGLVAGAEKLMRLFESADLVYRMQIHPLQVGFHPANRDGLGGTVQGVLSLAHDIAFVGWSWAEVAHALCVEVAVGDASVESFNRTLCDGCGLAPVGMNTIRFGSLSCGHTNMGLRAIAAAVPSDDELLSENGRLSVERLAKRDPEYAKAVQGGLRWQVLRPAVAAAFPDALPILQAARNVAGNVHRGENEVQGLCAMQKMAAAFMRRSEDVDWAVIKRAILRSKPPFASRLDDLIRFVCGRSGGVDGLSLAYMASFHRLSVDPAVRAGLPAGVYGQLADMKEHFVAMAIWCAAYTCPPDFVKHGLCSWVTVGDVAAVLKCAHLAEAETSLREARLRLKPAGIEKPVESCNELVACLGRLDVLTARFLMRKQDRSAEVFDGVAAVGHRFLEALAKAFPSADLTVFDDLWPHAEAAAAVPTKVAAEARGSMPLYTISGAGERVGLLAKLRAKGLDRGSVVSADGLSAWQIIDVTEASHDALLESVSGSSAGVTQKRVAAEALLKDWVPFDAGTVVENHPQWPGESLMVSGAARSVKSRAAIVNALSWLAAEMSRTRPQGHVVSVRVRPSRSVWTASAAAAGAVVLVPETLNIKATSLAADPPAGGLEVTLDPPDDSGRYWLLPSADKDHCVPCWFVRGSADFAEVNLVAEAFKVTMLLAQDYDGVRDLPAGRPACRKRGKQAADADRHEVVVVSIPCLVSSCALPAGVELRTYVAAPAKRAREAAAITLERVSKRKA